MTVLVAMVCGLIGAVLGFMAAMAFGPGINRSRVALKAEENEALKTENERLRQRAP